MARHGRAYAGFGWRDREQWPGPPGADGPRPACSTGSARAPVTTHAAVATDATSAACSAGATLASDRAGAAFTAGTVAA